MLKSPTSILNSIQRMKTNLRNDKEQLRIIKTNFVYLDHIEPRSRPFDHETKSKNRSKSVLYCPNPKESSVQQSLHDKQNDSSRVNAIYKECESKAIIKDQASTQRQSVIKSNRVYLPKQQPVKEQQNILNDQSNFRKNDLSRVSHHDETKLKQSSQIKNLKQRYQSQIEKLKQTHENEKKQLLDTLLIQGKEERESYQRQIQQMKGYIELVESRLQQASLQSNQMVNTSCQVTQDFSLNKNKPETVEQSVQATQFNSVNHFSSIASSDNNHFTSQTQSQNPTKSQHNAENSHHPLINGISAHQNNIIEELCLKYFGNASSDHIIEDDSFQATERQKYEHIINKLLEENTKLYHKIQKIYGQAHSSENPQTFFKSFGINYKTVSSHGAEDSHQHSSVTDRSRVINKYPSSKDSNSNVIKSLELGSQFNSRVTESQNYHSQREASNQNKGKQSIIYRISNVMSASMMKDGKSSSRSKIPSKNPPVKAKPGINVSIPQQRKMKTEMSQKSSQFNSYNFNSNPTQSFEGESRQIGSQERIPTMRQKLKNEPSFKFYDQDSSVSEKERRKNYERMKGWQEESESEIKDDEIKLKTIKNFRCLQNA